MSLKDLVLKSRSYRNFDESYQVSEQQLKDLVNLARHCPSSLNMQPIKYVLCASKESCDIVDSYMNWAIALTATKIKLPYEGKRPTAYIMMCIDTDLPATASRCDREIGIFAQTMLLGATEMGLGGCMLGAFDPEKVRVGMNLPENLKPTIILALGKPDDCVVIDDVPKGQVRTPYYRDENDVNHVPKRTLEELIVASF